MSFGLQWLQKTFGTCARNMVDRHVNKSFGTESTFVELFFYHFEDREQRGVST